MFPSRGRRRTLILQTGLPLIILSTRIAAQSQPQINPRFEVTTCTPPWFLFGSENELPCTLLVDAMNGCLGDDYTLVPISSMPLGYYTAPTGNATTCECNEVMYNLFQACAACQLGSSTTQISTRQTWFANCPTTPPPIHPPGFIENTTWATQVYIPAFSYSEALDVVRTGRPPPTPVGSSLGGAETAVPSIMSDSTGGNKRSPAATIIGIVVGCVAFLSIIAFIVIFLVRRKRSRTAPSKEFMQYAPVNQAIIPFTQAHDEESASFQHANRNSTIRHDSAMTEELETLPSFTPGLFKDPIFEKGVALNIANNAGYSGATGSPVTYSPATPSSSPPTLEGQRLVASRQASGS